MTSVYYVDGGRLATTHYCMLGNRPVMLLKSSSDKGFVLEEDHKRSGIKKGDTHMHRVGFEFKGGDAVTESWTMFEHGGQKSVHAFELTRAPK